MSDFEEYIKNKYPSDYLLMTVRYPDQELCELYSDQFEVWRHQQTEINQLKTQLAVYKEDMQKDAEKIGGLQKRIDAVKAIMNEYYTGSFDESAEMAGLISLALRGQQ